MKVLLGKKLGMTQFFGSNGRAIGVTAIEVWPATVLRLRTTQSDGYEAMQLAAGSKKRAGKAALGQGGGTAYHVIAEFPKTADVKAGDVLGIEQLEAGQHVTVSATSKGKGFQGTVKRHNFHRGPKTHGSRNYRAPGSIGGTDAARVFPGQKMPGRMGAARTTTRNLAVAAIHSEDNVVLLQGSVPGPAGGLVELRAA